MIDEKLQHIAIILDGNGRWAKERGLTRSMGHKYGFDNLQDIAIYAAKIGIKVLSVYAFSVDNFKRSKEEVDFLMNLFVNNFKKKYEKLKDNDIKVIFSGARKGLRDDVIEAMDYLIDKTKDNKTAILNICLNYGGQEEIIRASEKYHDDIVSGKVEKGTLTRDDFYRYLDHNLPPIDLVIRTGGEKRLSNFMLYQLTYAEIYFIEPYWPAFTHEMLDDVIDNFYHRDRRFGGINEKKDAS